MQNARRSTIAALSSCGALVMVLLGGSSVSAQTPPSSARVGSNVRLGSAGAALSKPDTNPLRGRDIPAFAVDPADSRHIVLVSEELIGGQCDYHVTFDGGKTWIGDHLRVPSDFAQPPCDTLDSGDYAHFNKSVVFGSGQNVYTTFTSHRGPKQRPSRSIVQGEGDSVMVAKSTDGGRSFGTAVVAIQGSPDSQPFLSRPGVAVQARPEGDRLYVIGWSVVITSGAASGGGGARDLVTSRSDDAGATWSAPVQANAPGELIREATAPVVGPDGTVYVAWRNRDAAPAPNNIILGRSTDNGATWVRTVGGNAAATGTGNNGGFPRLAIDPKSGTVYVVYEWNTAGDVDIYLQRSTDKGVSLSAPVRVNDDPVGNGVAQVTPQVSVAPNGRVDIMWLDRRNAYPTPAPLQATLEGDIYYASSADAGQAFSVNRRITDRSINFDVGLDRRIGSYILYGPAQVPLGNDSVLFAWADSRNGNVDTDTQDLYLARMDLTAAGPAPLETMPKTSTIGMSVALSQRAYPGGNERYGMTATSKVVIVNDKDIPGAMAGAVLARGTFGPLLLSSGTQLTKAVTDEIVRMQPSGVYLVGTPTQLSDQIAKDLDAVGVKANVKRLSGATPEETAAAVAHELDVRSLGDAKAQAAPAVAGAVIVNPTTKDAASAVSLASANRFPVLFVSRDAVPEATSEALKGLGVAKTLVVGDTGSVSDAVVGQLPAGKRLNDAAAVAGESKAMGIPTNVVYVAEQSKPMDQVLIGAAAARLGGVMVAAAGPSADAARKAAASVGAVASVDRVVATANSSSSRVPWPLLVGFLLLALIGIGLFLMTRARA